MDENFTNFKWIAMSNQSCKCYEAILAKMNEVEKLRHV